MQTVVLSEARKVDSHQNKRDYNANRSQTKYETNCRCVSRSEVSDAKSIKHFDLAKYKQSETKERHRLLVYRIINESSVQTVYLIYRN